MALFLTLLLAVASIAVGAWSCLCPPFLLWQARAVMCASRKWSVAHLHSRRMHEQHKLRQQELLLPPCHQCGCHHQFRGRRLHPEAVPGQYGAVHIEMGLM